MKSIKEKFSTNHDTGRLLYLLDMRNSKDLVIVLNETTYQPVESTFYFQIVKATGIWSN
jgi:hypothetical protein